MAGLLQGALLQLKVLGQGMAAKLEAVCSGKTYTLSVKQVQSCKLEFNGPSSTTTYI